MHQGGFSQQDYNGGKTLKLERDSWYLLHSGKHELLIGFVSA